MASTGIFALTRFTALAAGDVIPAVDISDPAQNAHGSLDSITVTNLFASIPVPVNITSASATALAVGLTGATNSAFVVDASTALQVAGLKVIGAVTGGTVALVTIDSGAATNLTINAKGTGTIGIGSVSTGRVTITPVTTITGSLTLSAALIYGGVTLTNAVTGTGNMVLSASPTLTGTAIVAAVTASGAITANLGVTVLAGQALTVTGATITGAPTWGSTQTLNTSGTAAFVTNNTQAGITSASNLVTVGMLSAGSIAAGFGNINNSANTLTTGALTAMTGVFGGGVLKSSFNLAVKDYFNISGAANPLMDLVDSANLGTKYGRIIYTVGPNILDISSTADGQAHFTNVTINGGQLTVAGATGAATFVATVAIGSRGAFATGDKYLICDSSGNVHQSALGPLS